MDSLAGLYPQLRRIDTTRSRGSTQDPAFPGGAQTPEGDEPSLVAHEVLSGGGGGGGGRLAAAPLQPPQHPRRRFSSVASSAYEQKEEKEEKQPAQQKARGRGYFGCVVGPPVPRCTAPQVWEQDAPGVAKISKLYFNPRHQRKELELAKLVQRRADPNYDFTPRVFGGCAITEQDARRYSGCGRDDSDPDPFLGRAFVDQLVMADAGVGWNVLPRPISVLTLLSMVQQTASHLQHLNLAGLLHNDLKQDNVLFDPITQRVTLIDFSLLRDKKDMWGDWYEHRMSPPESSAWVLLYASARAHIPEPVMRLVDQRHEVQRGPPVPVEQTMGWEQFLARNLRSYLTDIEWESLLRQTASVMVHQRNRQEDLAHPHNATQAVEYVIYIGEVLPLRRWRQWFEDHDATRSDVYGFGTLVLWMLQQPGVVSGEPLLANLRYNLQILTRKYILAISPLYRWDWAQIVPELQAMYQAALQLEAIASYNAALDVAAAQVARPMPLPLALPLPLAVPLPARAEPLAVQLSQALTQPPLGFSPVLRRRPSRSLSPPRVPSTPPPPVLRSPRRSLVVGVPIYVSASSNATEPDITPPILPPPLPAAVVYASPPIPQLPRDVVVIS